MLQRSVTRDAQVRAGPAPRVHVAARRRASAAGGMGRAPRISCSSIAFPGHGCDLYSVAMADRPPPRRSYSSSSCSASPWTAAGRAIAGRLLAWCPMSAASARDRLDTGPVLQRVHPGFDGSALSRRGRGLLPERRRARSERLRLRCAARRGHGRCLPFPGHALVQRGPPAGWTRTSASSASRPGPTSRNGPRPGSRKTTSPSPK